MQSDNRCRKNGDDFMWWKFILGCLVVGVVCDILTKGLQTTIDYLPKNPVKEPPKDADEETKKQYKKDLRKQNIQVANAFGQGIWKVIKIVLLIVICIGAVIIFAIVQCKGIIKFLSKYIIIRYFKKERLLTR